MRLPLIAFSLLLPLALGGATQQPLDPELQKRLAGRIAEPPQECMTQTQLDGPAVFPGGIVYGTGKRVYLNRLGGGCTTLREGDAVRIDVLGGQICKGDIVTPFDPVSRIVRASCIMGSFEPLVKPDGDKRHRQ